MHSGQGAGIKRVAVSTECILAARLAAAFETSAVGPMCQWIEKSIEGPINAIRLRGKKGQRYQMCRNTKSKFNDPTVAQSCLLIG
jgi:hypothetical protein